MIISLNLALLPITGGEALSSHRVVALLAGNRDQCPRWSGGFVLWSPLTISTCWPDQMAGLCLIILIVYDQIQLIVDQITHYDSYQGFTALHLACWRGSVTVVRRLLNCSGGVSSARDSASDNLTFWQQIWPSRETNLSLLCLFSRHSDHFEKYWWTHTACGSNGMEAWTCCQGFSFSHFTLNIISLNSYIFCVICLIRRYCVIQSRSERANKTTNKTWTRLVKSTRSLHIWTKISW